MGLQGLEGDEHVGFKVSLTKQYVEEYINLPICNDLDTYNIPV